MNKFTGRLVASGILAMLGTWLVSLPAHALMNPNHNETLLRAP